MLCRRSYGLPRRFAPRNDMQKLAACPHNTWALPVYRRSALATADTPPSSACHCVLRSCNRRHASVFCMSLRTSAHTGVAIRFPRRGTWQGGSSLGEFVTPCVFALGAALRYVLPQEYGLPRRFAPRNDSGEASLPPLTPVRLQHVIASQCAHWRGNPHPSRST